MSEPPNKKLPLKKLPPKSGTPAGKIVQAVDAGKVYTLNTARTARGKKIILYGASGMGKTTLACMAPKPVFVAADDGIDEIVNPATGETVPSYTARSYADVRAILAQPKLFQGFETIILDNMTEVEALSVPYILDTVTKDGKAVKSIEGYGWGSGYAHIADHNTYVKYDLQRLADAGFNVVVICQMAPRKETSAEVDEYLKDGPKLVWKPNVKAFSVTEFVEWSDYCFKIGYSNLTVSNKRASSNGQRVIFTQPQPNLEAKARGQHWTRFPLISFENPKDDSIWKFVFEDAWKDIPEEEVTA
jgi:hypothetical protein